MSIVNLPRFSVAWFKDLKARDKPLHYGRRADPCGTQQSHFPRPPWILCDAWQRSTFLASYLSESSTNYDAFQLNFVHDFNHHQFQRFSLPESSVWGRFGWLLSRLAAQLSWFGTSVLDSIPSSLLVYSLISFFKKVLRRWNCENVCIASSHMTDTGYGCIDIYFLGNIFYNFILILTL